MPLCRRLRFPYLVLFLLGTSCAGGKTAVPEAEVAEKIEIRSEPTGAAVWMDGVNYGETPLEIPVSSGKDHTLIVKKMGFSEAVGRITRAFHPVSLMNLEGMLYWIVDLDGTAQWNFDRSSTKVTLAAEKKGTTIPTEILESVIVARGLTILPYKGRTAILAARH